MADDSSGFSQEDEAFAIMENAKVMLAETLALGTVPVEKEIEVRGLLIEGLFQVGVRFSNEEAIQDAIQHIGAILRKLPNDSPTRPKYLNELSKAKFELYQQLDSGHSLDLAVLYGRQAKESATASNPVQLEPDTYIQILMNLGHVLIYRYQAKGIPKDIDESIACKREILSLAGKTDDVYFLTLNNLASSLNKRYQARQGEEDEKEAQQLLQELVSSTSPGTDLRGVASAQLGLIAFTKFKRTASTEDIDNISSIYSFYKGSVEILADKWEEAGRLLAKADEAKRASPSHNAAEDTVKKESKVDPIVDTASSSSTPDAVQKQNTSDVDSEEHTSEKVDKGKGKATEDPPRKGHLGLILRRPKRGMPLP